MTTATKEISKVQQVRDLVKSYEGAMMRLLPKHVSVERMTQIALINIGKTPELAECHAASLVGAILESIRLTLEPGAGPGHTWLIPFFNKKKGRKEVQIIVDYRAIVKRLKTHAGASVVFAEIVHANDQFEYGVGPKGLYLNWKPARGDRGEIVDYFSAAWDKEGTLLGYNIMTANEIKAIETRSKASWGPWKTDPAWMGKKTVIRPLNKLIPHDDSILSRMGELADKEEFGIPQDLGMLVDPDEISSEDSAPEIAEPKRKSEAEKPDTEQPEAAGGTPNEELASDKQTKMLFAKFKNSDKKEDDYKTFLFDTFGIKTRTKIQKRWVDEIVQWIDSKTEIEPEPEGEEVEETAWPT